ncbi:ribosomal-protein-alanine acetyltransferase [Pilimelia anulata]|uniref:[Ribosomal protein bS18]-alanine N-acetyltransferase n=1 Tax=Pilimelia anulata TaxID=53371 RepID=A0A8J3BDJ0_9ACTN|nr:ribosomal protein S18-alanine N-acetyltransferase [Pilimelia anulata]GGJ99140.1 ribosomal-protein-alanine acetyltransferase [Pilimelia anulata]
MTAAPARTAAARLGRLRWWQLDAVLAVEADLFGVERWTAAMFWNELAAGHHYLAATAADGTLLGYAGLAVAPGEAWVQNIAVARPAQRAGVGRALLEALLAEAERRGAGAVLLEVAADNGPAQRLYDAYGFVGVGVRRGYYQPSNTDAIVMRRRP